jgi:Transposase DDE domain
MTTNQESDVDWERIAAHLPVGFRALAEEMGLLRDRPSHMKTKIRDIGVALRLVLHQAGTSSSLRATAALAAATGVVSMSAVSLHQWMKKLGPYLTALLAQMVPTTSFAPAMWGGFHVIGGDATTVQRPGSKGTTARVHYALRLADLTPRHIEVTDEHGGETARRFRAEAGELWLLDRGYANPAGVAAIRTPGAHIIVRQNRGTLPLYDTRGGRLDVAGLLRNTADREIAHQRRAFVHLGDERIAGRVCWLRIPIPKVENARQRARRETEGVCDEETLYTAEFVVVFTTVLHELSAVQVLELYRARWQIELEFKRSKSIRELDRLPNFLPETIHSWICAKLLLQLIATRMASPSEDFPPSEVRFALLANNEANQAKRRADGRRAMVRREAGMATRVRRAAASCAR